MKYVEDCNDAAHEGWGGLATLLTKQRFSPIREQWSRIFHFVTGRTIEEVATDPGEDTSPHAEIVKLMGDL
ncbi:hypothetical protein Dda_4204 [Drechslerella dactyloides]|uniref:Uncharacterized protein n=1 Tax=Drechslerella dactyloides TaxID=74499 RepID=A0AAD6NK88_DREDA|nr:hypothetical protein Dda_4204 [Drechslerella dactyloides]